jgi:hypothetical protein
MIHQENQKTKYQINYQIDELFFLEELQHLAEKQV